MQRWPSPNKRKKQRLKWVIISTFTREDCATAKKQTSTFPQIARRIHRRFESGRVIAKITARVVVVRAKGIDDKPRGPNRKEKESVVTPKSLRGPIHRLCPTRIQEPIIPSPTKRPRSPRHRDDELSVRIRRSRWRTEAQAKPCASRGKGTTEGLRIRHQPLVQRPQCNALPGRRGWTCCQVGCSGAKACPATEPPFPPLPR